MTFQKHEQVKFYVNCWNGLVIQSILSSPAVENPSSTWTHLAKDHFHCLPTNCLGLSVAFKQMVVFFYKQFPGSLWQ